MMVEDDPLTRLWDADRETDMEPSDWNDPIETDYNSLGYAWIQRASLGATDD